MSSCTKRFPSRNATRTSFVVNIDVRVFTRYKCVEFFGIAVDVEVRAVCWHLLGAIRAAGGEKNQENGMLALAFVAHPNESGLIPGDNIRFGTVLHGHRGGCQEDESCEAHHRSGNDTETIPFLFRSFWGS